MVTINNHGNSTVVLMVIMPSQEQGYKIDNVSTMESKYKQQMERIWIKSGKAKRRLIDYQKRQ